jgi:glycosyltransferase involved in cell wall biosynthesis
MRIAAFVPSLAVGTGGTERCAGALLVALAARGHAVTAFASDVRGAALPGVEVRRVPRLPWPSPVAYGSYLVSAALVRRLGGGEFDLVYSAGANTLAADVVTAHYSAARGRRLMRGGGLELAGSPLRRAARRAFLLLAERAERRLYRSARCRRVIAVSARLKAELIADYRLEPAKVTAVPNGVDGAEFHPGLFLGGDWERKGLATLLEALARPELAGTRLRLAVVGQGDAAAWGRRAAELGLAGRALFPGPTSRPAEWYAAADFLVLPARYEPFGLGPLEAGACATPAVFSALCGCAEVLADGAAGLHLADPRDAGELAVKIGRLAADEEMRGRLAAGARAAAEHWGWSRVAAATEAVLEQVLEEKSHK